MHSEINFSQTQNVTGTREFKMETLSENKHESKVYLSECC